MKERKKTVELKRWQKWQIKDMKKADEPKQIRGREELQGRMKNSSEGR